MRKQAEVGKVYRTALVPELRSVDEENRTIEFVASTEIEDPLRRHHSRGGLEARRPTRRTRFFFGRTRAANRPSERPSKSGRSRVRLRSCRRSSSPTPPRTRSRTPSSISTKGSSCERSASFGFMPLEMPNRITDLEGNATGGYEFTSQELLELSAVPIPANPEALARCVQKVSPRRTSLACSLRREPDAVYRELAEINHEIALVAVGLARATLLKADEVRALLKTARLQPESNGYLTTAEVLAAISRAAEAVKSDSDIDGVEQLGTGEITTLAQLAAAVGSDDEPSSIEEVFSDSRSLRTGKFQFALRSELR